MIIVSQDKETIVNFENITRISIVPPVEEGYKCAIAINGCLDLGYYKTEERAKEVLQEIIRTYVLTEQYKVEDERPSRINLMMEGVLLYEMPKK